MNAINVIKSLKLKYPGKNIVKNNKVKPTEIICELGIQNDGTGIAIAVIDKSVPHIHHVATETYEILKGNLTIYKNNQSFKLSEKEKLVINPEEKHYAEGNETWVKVTSTPPWSPKDHIILNQY